MALNDPDLEYVTLQDANVIRDKQSKCKTACHKRSTRPSRHVPFSSVLRFEFLSLTVPHLEHVQFPYHLNSKTWHEPKTRRLRTTWVRGSRTPNEPRQVFRYRIWTLDYYFTNVFEIITNFEPPRTITTVWTFFVRIFHFSFHMSTRRVRNEMFCSTRLQYSRCHSTDRHDNVRAHTLYKCLWRLSSFCMCAAYAAYIHYIISVCNNKNRIFS